MMARISDSFKDVDIDELRRMAYSADVDLDGTTQG
jgi:hypothetical protein